MKRCLRRTIDAGGPVLRLGGRLDYTAAMRMIRKGACAATVAKAAGSRARTRTNLKRVGLRIITRLRDRHEIYEAFIRQGFTLDDWCRAVAAATQATKIVRYYRRGRLVGEFEDPDWPARTAARQQYMESTGILDLPFDTDDSEESP